MFQLYNDLKRAYLIATTALIAIMMICDFIFIFVIDNTNLFLLSTFVYIFGYWVITFIFNNCGAKRYNKIMSLLFDNCDPIEYLNANLKLLNQNLSPNLLNLLKINISAGYISAGDLQQTYSVLSDIKLSGNENPTVMFTLYNNWLNYYTQTGNYENAAKAANDAQKYINMIKNLKTRQKANYTFNHSLAGLKIKTGDLYGAEAVLQECLKISQQKYYIINSHFSLAELYEKQGRIADAKREYELVASNGNKLAVSKKAYNKCENL